MSSYEEAIAADSFLAPIYIGSRVEHIADKWEGEVVRKSTGDAVIVLYKLTSDPQDEGIEYEVVVDELKVLGQIHTEDNVFLKEGDRAFNYYDMKPGFIVPGSSRMMPDVWFDFQHADGSKTILNGQRICSTEFAQKKGWI